LTVSPAHPVRVFNPHRHHVFVAQVMLILQVMKPTIRRVEIPGAPWLG
jgi:hypothetical protein